MIIDKKILIIDDDAPLYESLSEQLKLHEGLIPYRAASGEAALEQLKAEYFDVILLDVGLPDIDGRELCRLIRHDGIKTPIIMLTAAVSEADIILGLDSGANDYINKPFRLGILLARLRAQLRQHEQSEDVILRIGPYSFRPSTRLMTLEGNKKATIRLTEKEAAILKFLYRAQGEIIQRNILLHQIWGYNPSVATHTLETHVYRLRQKIEIDPSKAQILITEPGGYRLVRDKKSMKYFSQELTSN